MRSLAWAALVTGTLAVRGALANEPDAYGFGSRGSAMGSAVAADASDFSAGYYNPAGLAGARGLELSLGYMHAENQLRTDGRDNGVANVHGLVGGLVAPGKLAGIPFAFGLATYLPDDGLSRIEARRQEVPRWELYEERASVLFLAANLAVRPLPWLELGGGLAFLAATRGRFAISGRANASSPYDSQLRHEVDADLTSVRYPQAGVRIRLGDFGKIGLVYRGETKLRLSLEAELEGIVEVAGIDVPLFYELETRTIAAFLPQQIVLGASFQKIENLRVNVDLTFVNWAAYESPTARTRAHLEAHPPPGTPLELPGDPKPTQIIAPAFENRLVPRLGVEYVIPAAGGMRRLRDGNEERRLLEIAVRAGYVFERSPVPPQSKLTNFVDADRHTLSFGAGAVVNAPSQVMAGAIRLDLHFQASILPERATTKTNPADFIGDYRSSGNMLSGGGTLTAAF